MVDFLIYLLLRRRRNREGYLGGHKVTVDREKRNVLGSQIHNSDDYSDMFNPF